MINVVWTSDLHLGLETDGINRDDEIIGIVKDAIKHSIKLKKQGNEVYFVIGGDIFNKNNPSETLINKFISGILNPLKKCELDTFIIAGNHDSLFNDPNHKSCLEFIRSANYGYSNIKLVDDIKATKIKTTDLGNLYFTFLPHITKSHIEGTKYNSVKEYINKKCESIHEKIGRTDRNFVFSHLNVKGVHAGSEENLLNKSEAYLPDCFIENRTGFIKPLILQGHIHSHGIYDNVHIVGSPIYCSYGETEKEKFFAQLDIAENMNEKDNVYFFKTNCINFFEFEVDFTSHNEIKWDFLQSDEWADFEQTLPESNYFLKISPTLKSTQNSFNWKKVKEALENKEKNIIVKDIIPRIVHEKVIRSEKQKLGLSPKEAVKVFLKTHKPKRAKEKWQLAQDYLQE